jgi:hypothetical protein
MAWVVKSVFVFGAGDEKPLSEGGLRTAQFLSNPLVGNGVKLFEYSEVDWGISQRTSQATSEIFVVLVRFKLIF